MHLLIKFVWGENETYRSYLEFTLGVIIQFHSIIFCHQLLSQHPLFYHNHKKQQKYPKS